MGLRTFWTILLLVVIGISVHAEMVLHYDFGDQTDPSRLADSSGKGHHAVVSNGYEHVEHQGRKGIRLNPMSRFRIQNEKELRLSGNMTLSFTFRMPKDVAAATARQAPLIFGSTEQLAVNRTYTMLWNRGNAIALNIGSGRDYVGCTIRKLNDGLVHNVVFLLDGTRLYAYLDGALLPNYPIRTTPLDPTLGSAPIGFGHWFAGTFPGELYDLRLYDEAVSMAEIMKGKEIKSDLNVEVRHSDFRDLLFWEAMAGYIPEIKGSLELSIDRKTVRRIPLPVEKLENHRLDMNGSIMTEDLALGRHTLTIKLLDESGKRFLETSREFEKAAVNEPEKYRNRIGVSDKVLPPWTPIRLAQKGSRTTVEVWNREYAYGEMPGEMSINIGGTVFADKASLHLKVNGADADLKTAPLRIRRNTPAAVDLLQKAENDALELSAFHTIEYDGFDKMKITITAKRKFVLDDLALVIPLEKAAAKWSVTSMTTADPLTVKRAYAFMPHFFIGSEYKGIGFTANSDEHWAPVENPSALTVDPGEKKVFFNINLVKQGTPLNAGETLSFEFALQGTPIKPMVRNAWRERFSHIRPYCSELDCLTPRNGKTKLQIYKEYGTRGFTLWRIDKPFSYPPIPGSDYCRKVTPIVKKAHEYGMTVFPYAIGFLFSELAPEWNDRDLYLATPLKDFGINGQLAEKETGVKQHTFYICLNPATQDLLLYKMRQSMLANGFDGVYLDGTADDRPCQNENHACGYILKGRKKRKATFKSFEAREFMKRLYTMIYELRGDKGVIDLHTSGAFNPSAVAYATTTWSGETLPKTPLFYNDLTPELCRAAYLGWNLGTSNEILHYATHAGYTPAMAVALVHDLPVRPGHFYEMDEMAKVWKIRDAFDCDNAEFIPYFSEACPVTSPQEGIYVSVYKRKDDRLLVIASNLSETPQMVTLEAKTPWSASCKNIRFKLEPQKYNYVELSPMSR